MDGVNVVYALESLGYEANVDFTWKRSTGLVWLHGSDPEPTEQEIRDAWDAARAAEEPILLEADRELALKKADSYAGKKRMQYIAAGVGQDLVYDEKVRQAQAFKDGGYVNPENYPFIEKEATALSTTPEAIADLILANRASWIEIGSDIEAIRLSTKEQIRNVTDRAQFEVILAAMQSAFDAIH